MVIETKALIALCAQVADWVAAAWGSARSKDAKRAATVLGDATVFLAAVHLLDNEFHAVMGELRLIGPHWPAARRDETSRRIADFAERTLILPRVRQAHAALQNAAAVETDAALYEGIQALVKYGHEFNASVGNAPTPFVSDDYLDDLLRHIETADTPERCEGLRQLARRFLATIDAAAMAQADTDYGRLRQTVLRRYPELPPPGWAAG